MAPGPGLLATTSPSVQRASVVLALLGTYGTWIRSLLNGTLHHLFRALHITGTLPGTASTPLKTTFTGIYWPIDYLLDVLVLFFYQAVDGSHPGTSLFGLYFATQYVPVIVSLYVDGFRAGKVSWTRNATLWLLAFQLTGIACTGPLLVLAHLGTTTLSHSLTFSPSTLHSIRVLPFSILFGYISLVIAMSLPSSGPRAIWSPSSHQIAIVAWNLFPIFLSASQYALERVLAFWSKASKASGQGPDRAIWVLRRAYGFGLFFSVVSQGALLSTTFSTVLFPTLFSPAARQALHPSKILRIPLSHGTVPSLGAGALQFMQWDALVGFLTVLIPAAVSYWELLDAGGKGRGGKIRFGLAIGGAALLLGPGGAVVLVRWLQDEEVYAREGQKGKGGSDTKKNGSLR